MRRRAGVVVHAHPVAARGKARQVEIRGETRELLPFEPVRGELLTWSQPHWKHSEYWLESARGTHLLVHIPGTFFCTPRDCPVESAADSWSIHMGWGIGTHAMPLSDAKGVECMRHMPGFLGRGQVTLADGGKLSWQRTWSGFELRDVDDQVLIEQRRSFAWFRAQATITLSDAGRQRADLLPLLALTWLAALAQRQHSH